MITSLDLLATVLLIQAKMIFAFLDIWARCWLMLSQLSNSTL